MMLVEAMNSSYYPVFNPVLYPFGVNPKKEKFVKRVLIIDDDKDMSELLKYRLQEDKKIKVLTAEDPFEALEVMNHQVVDTIILDWNLPELNGSETLVKAERAFKADPNLPFEWEDKKVKVIVLSGNDKNDCRASNTKHFRYSGYINKNQNNIESIVNSIRKYVHAD